jgi:signal transduction histidine kinase/ActR/RegA family two-component response regulator
MDVTERHVVESALRENEARFQRTVEAARIGTWDWNVLEDLIHVSHRAGERMLRDTAVVPLRRSADLVALIHEQDRDEVCRQMRESIRPGGRDEYEVEFRVPLSGGGVRWLWTPGRVTSRDAGGRATRLSGVVVDVTERRSAEEALLRLTANLEERVRDEVAAREEAQTQAAHAERMQALGRLAAGVAHDINNVLQTVSGAATMIERRPDNVASVRRLAQMSQDAAARGGSITGRLLAFGRRDVVRPEILKPATLLIEMRDMLAHTLGISLKVVAELQEGLPAIMVDRGQLETVLVNLAANARDAMPNGGTLTLSATTSGDQATMLLAPGEYVRIAITDTGTGMDSATLARVTEPFYTTKPPGKGTGLGLPMAKSVVEQAGGVLLIDSQEGQGTTVSLWLPRADTSAVSAPGDTRYDAHGRHRILLVDDDAMERETLAELLTDSQLAVLTAGGGNEALQLLEEGAEIDLIVTDLSMPDMDGITLIRQARVTHPELAAILLTGYADHAGARALSGEGRFQLLRKPVEGDRLVDQIEALLLVHEQGSEPSRV